MPIGSRAGRDAPPLWIRGQAELDDGWIVLDRVGAEEYQPPSEKDLLFDLADVRRPTDIVTFARRYGLLEHGPDADDLRERVEGWLETAQWLSGILLLYVEVRDASEGDETALAKLRNRAAEIAAFYEEPANGDEELLEQASHLIAWAISEGLNGVEIRVDAGVVMYDEEELGVPGVFGLSAHPHDLLGYVYFQLALFVTQRLPGRTCDECGRVFPVTHKRQRFCSEQCGQRSRYRRWAAKAKKERG